MASFLLLTLLALAQDPQADKCSISGTAVDAVTGLLLSNVEITAENPENRDSLRAPFITSDRSGKFAIGGLAPGQYLLHARRNGYLQTAYGERRKQGKGTPITLTAGQSVKELQFLVRPFGVIAGTVRDQDGEPLIAVSVTVYRVKFERGHRKTSRENYVDTDDLGQYRVHNLSPGQYYVRAEPDTISQRRSDDRATAPERPRETMVATLYPGVQDPSAARPVEVGLGAKVEGIDMVIPRRTTVRVTGHATAPAGTKLQNVFLSYAGGSDGLGFDMRSELNKNGDFEFPAVPAGAYEITATAVLPKTPSDNVIELMMSHREYQTRLPLQVSNLPVKNVQIRVEAGAEVTGRVRLEDATESKAGVAYIVFVNSVGSAFSSLVRDDQTFHLGLAPGHYSLDHQIRGGYIVQSLLFEGRNIFDEGLTISGPGHVTVEVVLGKEGAALSGEVVDKDGKPVSGATVVLVPEGKYRTRPDFFEEAQTDQAGRVEMKDVQPGNYLAFAWEDVEPGIWWDPDFLRNFEAKGVAVSMKASGRETVSLTSLVSPGTQ